MFVKRYASQHVPIYLQSFPSNSTVSSKFTQTSKFSSIYLLVGNCNFSLLLAFNALVGVFPIPIGIPGKVYSSEN